MCCLYCNNELKTRDQKKFCSRSCAASYNNHQKPKRIGVTQTCDKCKKDLGKKWLKTRKLCDECLVVHHLRNSSFKSLVGERTLREYLENYTPKTAANRYCGIRHNAAKIINRSGRAKECAVCGYSNHVEICHIKGIADHSMDSKISEINSLDNLVYLCPNHHWELDNTKKMVRSEGIEPSPRVYETPALPSELPALEIVPCSNH